jgi:glycine cleavage system aminomethyltransferase T
MKRKVIVKKKTPPGEVWAWVQLREWTKTVDRKLALILGAVKGPIPNDEVIPEGAYITVLDAQPDEHGKTRHTGFVTSSYYSPTLGRAFALALVADGLNRMGEVVSVPIGKKVLRATICDAVFIDKENIRRNY